MSASSVNGGLRTGPYRAYEEAQGATFCEVAGWSAAESFPPDADGRSPGLVAARRSSALVDLTPTGRLKVTGKDRKGLLQRISMNDLRPLEPGVFLPTVFGTAKGRIVDRALVFDRGESFLLVTAPEGRLRLHDWIRKYALSEDVRVTDVSAESGSFGLVGPAAPEIVRRLAGVGTGGLAPGRFLALPIEGIDAMVAPYDGLPAAWMVLADLPGVVELHALAVASGARLGAAPAPIGVRESEVLRIEAGIPADGHELTEEFNPWEAGLEGSFSLSKGCYTGQEVMARLKTYDKIQRRLCGIRLGSSPVPEVPQPVRAVLAPGDEHEAGVLTSAARSEHLAGTIGLGIIRLAYAEPGTPLVIGDARIPATAAPIPLT